MVSSCILSFNDEGDWLAVRLTPGNADDRVPVPGLAAGLWGKRWGNRGYRGQERFERLQQTGVPFITQRKRHRKNKLLPRWDKRQRRKRALIESVGEQLQPVCPIAHTRHRRVDNASGQALAALMAYT